MAEILEIAKNGALKTPIMCRANLCSAQLDEYLHLLLEIGLLEAVNKGEKNLYRTTTHGLHYIQGHKKLTALLDTEREWNIHERRSASFALL